MKALLALCLILNLLIIGYLIYSHNGDEDREIAKRADQYSATADSLRSVVQEIDARTRKKDSILHSYMASLDITLEELNKESKKNTLIILKNDTIQHNILSEYCHEMEALDMKPDYCK